MSGRSRWLGVTKIYDLCRVRIINAVEEQQFLAVVNCDEDWMPEGMTSHWGARGVALTDVVQERKAMLKAMIDQDLLEVEIPGVPNADTDTESINGEQTEQ